MTLHRPHFVKGDYLRCPVAEQVSYWSIWSIKDDFKAFALVTAIENTGGRLLREGLAIRKIQLTTLAVGEFYPGIRTLTDADKALIHLGRPDLIKCSR